MDTTIDSWRDKMNAKGSHTLVALVFATVAMAAAGTAQADESMAMQHAEMRQACAAQDGRFEKSWMYNDQGMKWGLVLSCVTGAGIVSCQDNVCETRRWARRDTTGTDSELETTKVIRTQTEPAVFADALAALSEN